MLPRVLIMVPQPVHILIPPLARRDLAAVRAQPALRLALRQALQRLELRRRVEVALPVRHVVLEPVRLLVRLHAPRLRALERLRQQQRRARPRERRRRLQTVARCARRAGGGGPGERRRVEHPARHARVLALAPLSTPRTTLRSRRHRRRRRRRTRGRRRVHLRARRRLRAAHHPACACVRGPEEQLRLDRLHVHPVAAPVRPGVAAAVRSGVQRERTGELARELLVARIAIHAHAAAHHPARRARACTQRRVQGLTMVALPRPALHALPREQARGVPR